jgi:probable phosphoglycerate mutase
MAPDPIIHIRHGETAWNLARRLQGSKDIPLNETGRAQAARNGRRLKELLVELERDPADMDWVASPMHRARETMEIIRREVGIDPGGYRIEDGLREISFGQLEGFTYEEMEIKEPALYMRLREDKWTFVPPDGENYVTLTERVAGVLATIKGPGIIVAHGGIFRALLSILRGYHDQDIAEMLVPQDRFFLGRGGREDWV